MCTCTESLLERQRGLKCLLGTEKIGKIAAEIANAGYGACTHLNGHVYKVLRPTQESLVGPRASKCTRTDDPHTGLQAFLKFVLLKCRPEGGGRGMRAAHVIIYTLCALHHFM